MIRIRDTLSALGRGVGGLRFIKKLKCTAFCHLSPSTILQFFD
jgi:hypothetical protein